MTANELETGEVEEGAERLARVARLAGLGRIEDAIPVMSHSNDAWLIGDTVVRICWRGDRGRLGREALVLSHLGGELPHPPVLDFGHCEDLSWLITGRLEGETLYSLWDSLTPAQRESAIRQLGGALAALHAWNPPEPVLGAMAEHEHQPRSSIDEVAGAFLVPLPASRLRGLIARAAGSPRLPAELADGLFACIDELAGIDPFSQPNDTAVLVHGDAHWRNVLWKDGRITALLDFEWSRVGPADLDLEAFLRFGGGDVDMVFRSLREAYPALLAHPDLASRLWLYELSHLLRQVLIWPPDPELSAELARAIAGRDRIAALVSAG